MRWDVQYYAASSEEIGEPLEELRGDMVDYTDTIDTELNDPDSEDDIDFYPLERAEHFDKFEMVEDYNMELPYINYESDAGSGEGVYDSKEFEEIYIKSKNYVKNYKYILPNATSALSHYLANEGTNYEIDVQNAVMTSFVTNELYNKNVNALIEHIKSVLKDGDRIYVVTKEMTTHDYDVFKALVDVDWIFTLGKSSGGIVAEAKRSGEQIDIRFRYIIFDFYDWDAKKDVSVIDGVLQDSEMYKLHHAGVARHFMIYGEKEYEIMERVTK